MALEMRRFLERVRANARYEPERRVVRDGERLLLIAHPDDAGDRTEDPEGCQADGDNATEIK